MDLKPLLREDLIKVIEGKGRAKRVPLLFHVWINSGSFDETKRAAVAELLSCCPMDAQMIPLNLPGTHTAPSDDPSYRWSYRDTISQGAALDNDGVIDDLETEINLLLADFPSADYPGLIPASPPPDGRYRVAYWFYFLFERCWSICGMENSLIDFYLCPDAVHTLFDKLTDFYIRVITRAK
ncbi:MAG: hypothetical protein J6U72_01590, partial [Clostridia bacterium]|nr:hypothetical protein [Clostridia bacterium]